MSNKRQVSIENYPGQCLDYLNRQRKEGFLCDIELVVNEKRFPAHRNVLATSCDYFATMFRTDMMEKYSDTVELKELSWQAIEQILDFIYSGNIFLCVEDVFGILQAASMFQMKNLLEMIDEYLLDVVEPSNSLNLKEISHLVALVSLQQKTEECTYKNFSEVCQSTKFLDLPKNEVQMFLQSDEIKVETEDVLFTALMNWTNHNLPKRQEAFPELFGLLRLQFVTKQFLSNTVRKEKLVRDNTACRDLVEDAMHFHIEPELFEKQQPRTGPRNVNKGLYILTPQNSVQTLQLTETTPKTEIVQPPFRVSYHSAIVLHENKVMFCGGLDTNCKSGTTSVMSFNGKSWTLECSLNFHRAGATAVSVKGSVYIFGGYSNQRFENQTERYVDGCWEHDMQKDQQNNRSEACVVVIGENVFLLGGRDTRLLRPRLSRIISSVDAVNVRTNQWKKVAPLNNARMNFAASAVGDVIYVFGGCSHSKQPFNSCEFLDTSTKNPTWTTLPYAPFVLNYATSFFISNDEIIVLGGTRTHTWKDTFTNSQQEQEKLGEAVISSKIFGFIM